MLGPVNNGPLAVASANLVVRNVVREWVQPRTSLLVIRSGGYNCR